MATKSIITRIKNKVDNLSTWQNSQGVLLDGEIAIVRVPTGETYTNPVTGKAEPAVELLMKVGDGEHTFNEVDSNGNPYLPWLSAKASDVYHWAKTQDPSSITVSYVKDGTTKSSTLADVLKDLETAETAIEGLKSDVSGVRGLLSVDPDSETANGVVQGITYNASTGKFSVSYGLVQTADINDSAVTTIKIADANVTTAKIADNNVTTAKIAAGAVTNDKLGSDISTDKINVGDGDVSGTLSAKIKSMDATIAGKAEAEHGTHVIYGGNGSATTVSRSDHNHDSVYIKPADVDTKINTALGSVLKYKGTKTTTAQLPTSGNATGDVWNITNACDADSEKGLPAVNAGDNVAWNGSSWDVLAGTVDLSSYYTEDEVNALLADKSETSHNHKITVTATGDGVVVLAGSNEDKDANVKITASHAASGVTAGTYKSVTVDVKGHVIAGSNPTTIAGFGITDAYTKDEVNSELDKKVDKTDSRLTDARTPLAHNHESSDINKMTGYSKPSSTSAINASDTLNAAIGKLEKALDGKGTSNLTIGTTATTAAAGNHTHSGYESRMTSIENNYVKVADDQMYLGSDVIIFDCGGAPV
jgi:hypothetical protein